MLRQSPSRNQRSKGIKVKHVLQICLLLAVCFWLIYQVKHSHDKKREFDDNDAKISLSTHGGDEIIKFGRKDLHPHVEEIATKVRKQDEEEAEEENGSEEDNKHEEEEQEEESKTEEKEVHGGGGGDDEIDERDQEKSNLEVDQEEEMIDEEKEREEGDDEKESEERDGQMENEGSLEDDHDGGAESVHEAREEHYKADDASSAVTHEAQTVVTKGEAGSLETLDDKAEKNVLEHENKVSDPEETSIGQNTSRLMVGNNETTETEISVNATVSGEKSLEVSPSEPQGGSILNSTLNRESIDQPEQHNSSTEVSSSVDAKDLLLQNGTETQTDLSKTQNATAGTIFSNEGTTKVDQVNGSIAASEINSSVNHSISNVNENQEETPSKSSISLTGADAIVSEEVKPDASFDSVDTSQSSVTEVSTDETQNEKSDTEKDENDELSGHDPNDSSDSSMPLEKEVRTDLDTLPEIQTEGSNTEDAAAE